MEILGERWTFVVLREVFNGVRRFDDMRRHAAIPRQVLTNRLGAPRRPRHPAQGALPATRASGSGTSTASPPRASTSTPSWWPIGQWGDRYLADPEGSPVEFAHRDCGAAGRACVLRCTDGHEITDNRDVATRPGPGVIPLN